MMCQDCSGDLENLHAQQEWSQQLVGDTKWHAEYPAACQYVEIGSYMTCQDCSGKLANLHAQQKWSQQLVCDTKQRAEYPAACPVYSNWNIYDVPRLFRRLGRFACPAGVESTACC